MKLNDLEFALMNNRLRAWSQRGMETSLLIGPRAVRDVKVKALRAVRKSKPEDFGGGAVRGRYAAGEVWGERVHAYGKEQKVAADSQAETYAALKLHSDNLRRSGVPFYLSSGKRLVKRATEIVVEFKPAPHTPWRPAATDGRTTHPNLLVVKVSPREGIIIRVEAKQPGQEMRLQSINLDYCHSDERGATESLSTYEHLLLDSMRGGPTFFARADEAEAAWEILEPVIEKWEAESSTDSPTTPPALPVPRQLMNCSPVTDVAGTAQPISRSANSASGALSSLVRKGMRARQWTARREPRANAAP